MKRRDFIYHSAAGTAFFTLGGFSAFSKEKVKKTPQFAYQSERKIPIIYHVDVIVVGGSTAGIAAAVNAAQNGAQVFLAAQEPYLGEDICGTYRIWREDINYSTSLEEQLFGEGLPTPMHIKHTLDQQLIDNKVNYLYSSYVTDLITDEKGNPAGVVISNRSGRQAIIGKVIIDTTPRAMVARMTNARFSNYPSGKHFFKFTVVGNHPKEIEGGSYKIQPVPVKIKDRTYQAIEYSVPVEMKDNSWASFAEAEQLIRDLTWDANQVEKSDLLFQIPPDRVNGQKCWNSHEVDSKIINLHLFQPRKTDRIFVLSGCADLSDGAAETLLQPGALIAIGERIGNQAAIIASQLDFTESPIIKSRNIAADTSGDVGELLQGLRPSLNQGHLLSEATTLPVLGTYDVVVMGGGTAGAPAEIGAARNGASTLILEYLHDLGGIGTQGLIGRYWAGYRKGFTNEVDEGVKRIGGDNPRKKERLDEWVFDWKTEWYRSEIRKAGGEIWFGVLGYGAYIENSRVKGVVVATPNGKGIVLANTVIDSTGSADIAIAAGAKYSYTDAVNIAVQGAGLPPQNPEDFYNNTDWTFTNDTDMLDVWRTFIVGKNKFKDQYDIGKLPQTRERRRMVGDFIIGVLDIYNHRTYPDTISIHESSFDTHGFTIDPYFSLKPPADSGVDVLAYVPFRALLPKGLDGIVVTGLGASAHRDAMPVIRMQSCLQNQGFAVGMAAAMATDKKQQIRYIDIKKLQQRLVKIGSLTSEVLTHQDNYPPTDQQIRKAAQTVVNNLVGLEILLWDPDRGIPAMSNRYLMCPNPNFKLVYARILGMLGHTDGYPELHQAVLELESWDEGWDFRGMGQFGRSMSSIDTLIIALGNCKKVESIPAITSMAIKLTPESHFSHYRAVALALETIADEKGAKMLYELLQLPGMTGHAMTNIHEAIQKSPPSRTDTSTRNNSLRELIMARALYKCGDHKGLGNQILMEYSKDLRGHYFRHANGILQTIEKTSKPKIEM